mmetsp:Transcript_49431/g.125583  ORF Transcript_49431/g.125583 Transcript_49431/m.125583 type:complete len:345 (+) Transcript_49431:19-1053(+)
MEQPHRDRFEHTLSQEANQGCVAGEHLGGLDGQVWPLFQDALNDLHDVAARSRMPALLQKQQRHPDSGTGGQRQQGILEQGAVEVELRALPPLHADASHGLAQLVFQGLANGLPGACHSRHRRAMVAKHHAIAPLVAVPSAARGPVGDRQRPERREAIRQHVRDDLRACFACPVQNGAEADEGRTYLHIQVRRGQRSIRHGLGQRVARTYQQGQHQDTTAAAPALGGDPLQPARQDLRRHAAHLPGRDAVREAGRHGLDPEVPALAPQRGLQVSGQSSQRQCGFRLQGTIVDECNPHRLLSSARRNNPAARRREKGGRRQQSLQHTGSRQSPFFLQAGRKTCVV